MRILPVILSGGSGSRLWPLSRDSYPKQFISLTGEDSLLQQTLKRLEGLSDLLNPLIICNEAHRFLVAEQLRAIDVTPQAILLEPCARNTAPAIALAALYAQQMDENIALLVLPADHLIQDAAAFCEAVNHAVQYAQQDKLITFGIVPESPHTGYGYIKQGEKLDERAFLAERFVEKPKLEKAQQYVGSTSYYWNGGIFLFNPESYVSALSKYAGETLRFANQALKKAEKDLDFLRIDKASFSKSPACSVDYAVMEHAENVIVVPMSVGWSDVGSWSSLYEIEQVNQQGNVLQGDVIAEAVKNSYLRAEDKLLAVVGVEDHIVIETKDAVLVAHKSSTESVKTIVKQLTDQSRVEATSHPEHYRPWGYYELLNNADGFQVRKVCINPGKSISLQIHQYRSEHWIVLSGVAKVNLGEEVLTVSAGGAINIDPGVIHQVVNAGLEMLVIVEVQVGEQLDENDVSRLERRVDVSELV